VNIVVIPQQAEPERVVVLKVPRAAYVSPKKGRRIFLELVPASARHLPAVDQLPSGGNWTQKLTRLAAARVRDQARPQGVVRPDTVTESRDKRPDIKRAPDLIVSHGGSWPLGVQAVLAILKELGEVKCDRRLRRRQKIGISTH
jgi:hypothetical protein